MSMKPRYEVVKRGEVGVYHLWNRASRQIFQFGYDPQLKRDRSDRRRWVHDLERELAALFGLDICFHAEMGNHLHLIVRTRPDVVQRWDDREVVRRWLRITKIKANSKEQQLEPTQEEIDREMQEPGRAAQLRRRLSHPSWFMGTLCENLSRRINAEEEKQGTLWEGRYQCRALTYISAILICAMYLDLNPVRAGEVQTPEQSVYTSVYERIVARQQRLRAAAAAAEGQLGDPVIAALELADDWLCPLTLVEGPAGDAVLLGQPSQSGKRCSDKGILPLTLDEYLTALDYAGRVVRGDKPGAIPAELPPILERLAIRAETFGETVASYDAWFHRLVGPVEHLMERAAEQGRRWYQGQRHCAEVFLPPK